MTMSMSTRIPTRTLSWLFVTPGGSRLSAAALSLGGSLSNGQIRDHKHATKMRERSAGHGRRRRRRAMARPPPPQTSTTRTCNDRRAVLLLPTSTTGTLLH